MATRKHSGSHKKSHTKKSHTKKAHGANDAYCPKCKKMVALKEHKVVSFTVNGSRRKRIAGVGMCGHKVSKFLKSDA